MSAEDKNEAARQPAEARERERCHGLREISSQDLLRDSRAVRIRHGGEVYTLRHTINGKLILTK